MEAVRLEWLKVPKVMARARPLELSKPRNCSHHVFSAWRRALTAETGTCFAAAHGPSRCFWEVERDFVAQGLLPWRFARKVSKVKRVEEEEEEEVQNTERRVLVITY